VLGWLQQGVVHICLSWSSIGSSFASRGLVAPQEFAYRVSDVAIGPPLMMTWLTSTPFPVTLIQQPMKASC